ncbi:MAG: carboxypeptidase M32 [Planctomycetota bacterium]
MSEAPAKNDNALEEIRALWGESQTLASAAALLAWDQETYMPASAGPARAEQSALLARLVHERRTAPRVGELLDRLDDENAAGETGGIDDRETTRSIARELRRDHERAVSLPSSLVADLARAGSIAQDAWKHARANNDFAAFAPHLGAVLSLTREKARCLKRDGQEEIYDALLDEYEPDTTGADIDAVFGPLRERLAAIVDRARSSGTRPDTSVLDRPVPEDTQHDFGLFVLRACGFDLDAGRLDVTTHPFCEGLAPGDTRLTTRYKGDRWSDALYGTLHEMGHGLYEQGLPKADHWGTPLAESVSLGIHESQSRLWENLVGRSGAFWAWALPHLARRYGEAFTDASVETLTRAVNTVEPSLIRVEADEGTYNLHVMIRYELERSLIREDLSIGDLPGAWNERYRDLLGIEVPDDRRGCLQDVHWSFGLVGYFPTYTLGNLYASQLWEAMGRSIDLPAAVAAGEFGPLLAWLREHIHAHGRRYSAAQLCERATGEPLSAEPLLRHLDAVVRESYNA